MEQLDKTGDLDSLYIKMAQQDFVSKGGAH